MFRKTVTYVTLVCLLAAMPIGCYSRRAVPVGEIELPDAYTTHIVVAIVTTEGEVLEFPRSQAPRLYSGVQELIGTPNRRSRPIEGGGWTEPKDIPPP